MSSREFSTLDNILSSILSFVWNNNEANPTTKNRTQMNVSLIDFSVHSADLINLKAVMKFAKLEKGSG